LKALVSGRPECNAGGKPVCLSDVGPIDCLMTLSCRRNSCH